MFMNNFMTPSFFLTIPSLEKSVINEYKRERI